MCDAPASPPTGWLGWQDLPPPAAAPAMTPTGPWLDLSHVMRADMPRVSFFEPPRFEQIWSIPEKPINVTEMQMVVHTGTHIDAPIHFLADGPALHEVPLERLAGPGVVIQVDRGAGEEVSAADLAHAADAVQPGDIVALHTGWWRKAGTHDYEDHPSVGLDAAWWLVERKAKMLLVDTPTPDLPVKRRPAGFAWPIHHTLLCHGVLICEHLCGHTALLGADGWGRAEFVVNALNIEGADGAPVRVLARPVA